MSSIEELSERIRSGDRLPIYLVAGDRVLSEPAAFRLATALAGDNEPAVHRRPSDFSSILDDLRTLSLFATSKVVMVVESSLFADRASAADLIDQAAEASAIGEGGSLSAKSTEAATSLLQALRLFGVDPTTAAPEQTISALPRWALEGGAGFRKKRRGRGRGKKQVQKLEADLGQLLGAATEAGLTGWGDSVPSILGDILDRGLPEGHYLVLAESVWARDHPIVARLIAQGAVSEVGGLTLDRRGSIDGLELVAAELARETGKALPRAALRELGRRTIKKSAKRGRYDVIDADSTGRFVAEYRKLAALAGSNEIDVESVRATVEDRGEEDVWAMLDDLAAGRAGKALHRLRRIELAATDSMASRLSMFSLLAEYCRQLVAVRGLMRLHSVPAGENNYQRFKNQWAPALKAPIADNLENPIASLHPYRLHRVYLAASRLSERQLQRLPEHVLVTEGRIKGESAAPATALSALLATLAAWAAKGASGSRRR